ncbi:MAG TPA: DUF4292 domain-containing protein [Flavipsychrobacter sp.]|nr:DUF4292 domain-containing protein [Flavipsychrobacter sp.]
MNKYIIGIVILLGLSINACKISKKATVNNVTVDTTKVITDTTVVTKPVVDSSKPSLITGEKKVLIASLSPLLQQKINYTTFSGKAKMNFEGPDMKQEFTANIRIRKDSIIWVAITALGGLVQVARVGITPDSITIINYLQKEVTKMPLTQAAKLLPTPVDFSSLQNFIVGNTLIAPGNVTDATDSGGTWSLQEEDSNYIQQVTYNKSDTTMSLSQLKAKTNSGPQAMIQYGNYEIIGGQKLSASRTVNIQNAGLQYYLDMNFANADFDQQLDYPFSIPKNYTIK